MHVSRLLSVLLTAAISQGAIAQDLYDETLLRTLHLTFAQSNWYALLQANYNTGVELAADLTVDNVTYRNVGVHFRGQSSYSFIGTSQKKPFGISMDANVPGQRLYGYKTLNLNNGFRDPTFVREVLSYSFCRQFLVAGKANFVVLRVNNENWGVYINVQQINKDMMDEWFVDEDGTRFEADALLPGAVLNGSCLTNLGTTAGAYDNNYECKTLELPDPWTPLITTCVTLNSGSPGTVSATLTQRLAVDQAQRMVAAMIVLQNPDSYISTGHNYYVYHDVFHDRIHTIPWGLNLALGCSTLGGSTTAARATWNLFTNSTSTGRPLLNRLWAVPELRERYLAHVRTMLDQAYSWPLLQPRIAAWQALIATEVGLDTKKLYTTASFTSNVTADFVTGGQTISGLQPLITQRRTYLTGHAEVARPAPVISNVAHTPLVPPLNAPINVTATVTGPSAPVGTVTLWSRAIGAYTASPMFDDGLHGDGGPGDGVFGAAMPTYPAGSLVQYYIGAATASGGAHVFFPRTAEFQPRQVQLTHPPGAGPVRINEFLALNTAVIQDPAGEWEDYVELHNASAAPITVGGMYLTDNLQNPTKWQLPTGTAIPAGGVLLIWCDEDGPQGPLHANFKLSGTGEELGLFAADGVTLLDQFTFGPQIANIATGRLFDGSLPWVTFPAPTPNTSNNLAGCGSRAYSAQSYASHTMTLRVTGSPAVGQTFHFATTGGPPQTPGLLVLAMQPAHIPVPGSTVTALIGLDPTSTWQPLVLDGSGAYALPVAVPQVPSLAGFRGFVQVAVHNGTSFFASNGLEVVICP